MIKASHDSLGSKHIAANNKPLDHINLCSLYFVVFVLFVPQSVLIKPVINLSFGINGVSEVRRS